MSKTIEIELDTPRNGNVQFPPLNCFLRGRFDFLRAAKAERNYHAAGASWPATSIPGQIVGFDPATNEGYVREPLHDSANIALAEKVKLTHKLPPAREAVMLRTDAEKQAWLFAMNRICEMGFGRVVTGRFPDNIPCPAPKPGTLDPLDRLCAMIEKLVTAIAPKATA